METMGMIKLLELAEKIFNVRRTRGWRNKLYSTGDRERRSARR
jgi:hypothetical protein